MFFVWGLKFTLDVEVFSFEVEHQIKKPQTKNKN